MDSTDIAFAGSIPAIYDRYLAPLLFRPYAEDLVDRLARAPARRILEIAAGTGVVTGLMASELPQAEIVATDLNQAMLDVAAERIGSASVHFRAADAQSLPFEDASFDTVVCQFGVMFFPDRVAAYREALRVLQPGGRFLFNSWNRLDQNPVTRIVAEAVAAVFPPEPPRFFERVPFAYHDPVSVEADLEAAGFEGIDAETVEKHGHAESPRAAAIGLCQGTPLRAEIEARDPLRLDEATEAASTALALRYGIGPIEAPMSAHVFVASR